MADRSFFDINNRNSLIAVSNSDGTTPVSLWADPSTHALIVSASLTVGNKSNNGGLPGTNNLGVLPAVANAAAPSYGEGNQVALSTDLAGALRVTGSLSVGGTTDNSAYTAGSSTGTPAMGFYHSVLDTVTDGRAATVAITPKRAMMVNLQTAAGVETGIAAAPLQVSLANTAANATAIKVDGSAVTQPVSGTVTTTPPSNASTNIAQINAVTPLMGNGLTGTGSLRVTIASDNTAFAVNSTLSAETTKVIGTVNIAASQTIAVTNTGTFATQSTLAAETTKVIGTVNIAAAQTIATTNTGTFAVQADNTKIAGNAISAGNGTSGTGVQRVTLASDSTGQVAPAANATATGTSIYNNTALSSTKQAVNATAGNLYGYHIYNPNSVVIYVQLFNVASASVTVGTTPPTAVLAVPPLGWADAPPSGPPITFATALTIAATTTSTGLTAPSTALLCNIWYK